MGKKSKKGNILDRLEITKGKVTAGMTPVIIHIQEFLGTISQLARGNILTKCKNRSLKDRCCKGSRDRK